MNDSAKPANTPIADLEPNIELQIEELEKIVAPGFDAFVKIDGVTGE
jgi:hypothetical protein